MQTLLKYLGCTLLSFAPQTTPSQKLMSENGKYALSIDQINHRVQASDLHSSTGVRQLNRQTRKEN